MQIITLCELGGAQTVVVNLSNALCGEHEVIVVSGEGDGKMWNMLDNRIKKEHCIHLQRAISPIHDLWATFYFKKLYRKYKPDIIHLHSSKAGILGRLVFPKKKIIYTVHGFDSIRLAYRKFLPIERYMQHRTKSIVGVSEYDKQNLLSENITNNIQCVYNGIKRNEPLISNPFLSLEDYQYKILCIARLSPQKNCKLFLEVAKLLPKYAFIWIGNQENIKEEISSNVFFMGNLPNAGAYNEYVDLFMLPSNYEGLPMVIIEAMSFGKPIIASNVGGIKEIVKNNENGFALENQPKLFANKIHYILENKEIKEKFSKNSRQFYLNNLTVDKMVKGYLNIYKK